jgi:hypothetical protein
MRQVEQRRPFCKTERSLTKISLLWLSVCLSLIAFAFATPASAGTNAPTNVRLQMEAVLFPVCMERQAEDPQSQTWCRCFARSVASKIKLEQLMLGIKEGAAKALGSIQPSQFASVPQECGNPPRQFAPPPKKTPEEYKAETYRLIYPQCITRFKNADDKQAHSYCHCRATIVADEMKQEDANAGGAVLAELGRRIDARVHKECSPVR